MLVAGAMGVEYEEEHEGWSDRMKFMFDKLGVSLKARKENAKREKAGKKGGSAEKAVVEKAEEEV